MGFRYFTYRAAIDSGVKGWVKNLSNGDVELHAEGSVEQMEKFLPQAKQGPALAIVSNVNVQKVHPEFHQYFSIER